MAKSRKSTKPTKTEETIVDTDLDLTTEVVEETKEIEESVVVEEIEETVKESVVVEEPDMVVDSTPDVMEDDVISKIDLDKQLHKMITKSVKTLEKTISDVKQLKIDLHGCIHDDRLVLLEEIYNNVIAYLDANKEKAIDVAV